MSRFASSSLGSVPCLFGGWDAFLKKLHLLVEAYPVEEGPLKRLGRFCDCDGGRWVKLSVELEKVDARHISVEPNIGSGFSLLGEGTKLRLTGSEVPLNQLDSFVFLGVYAPEDSLELLASTSNSAASFGETRSGERDRSLLCFRKGKKDPEVFGDNLGAS